MQMIVHAQYDPPSPVPLFLTFTISSREKFHAANNNKDIDP